MTQSRYESWSRAFSFFLKVLGGAGIVFVPVFWAFTGKFEPAFLPFFGFVAGVGESLDRIKEIIVNRESKGGEK